MAGLKELLVANVRTEARVVAHLAELDARRLHLEGAPSLFEYCQKCLGLSDNQAYYRIAAARVARRFPIVFELLERHEIHLTNIAPLSKYLTEENHRRLLDEAGRLSKRELLKALARLAPRPDAPSHIRRLPPTLGAASAGPTGSLEPLSEYSYRLQLHTSEALKEKLELARDLMSHSNPSGDLAVVVERGLDLLIEKLQKRRFGQTARPQRRDSKRNAEALLTVTPTPPPPHSQGPGAASFDRSDRSNPDPRVDARTVQTNPDGASWGQAKQQQPQSARRGECSEARAHIPHETRRRLVERDGPCCSYIGGNGQRCCARAFLQIHHDQAWARGGADSLDNLRWLCAAHNQWLAEKEYGARHVRRAIEHRRCRADSVRRAGEVNASKGDPREVSAPKATR